MSTSIAQKLAIVFGVDKTITATHYPTKVIFDDGSASSLAVEQTDEIRQAPGIYDVTVKEAPVAKDASGAEVETELSYVIEQVFRNALPEVADKTEVKTKTKATPSSTQSPSGRLDEAPRRALR